MREKFVKDLETGKVYEKKALELIQKNTLKHLYKMVIFWNGIYTYQN